jgi:protein-S-isoprenylcysteine O-methyltransferase Ste14
VKVDRPESVSDLRINLVGLAAMVLATVGVVWLKIPADTGVPLLMTAAAAPILLLDLFVTRVHLRPSTGLDLNAPRPADPGRVAIKWIGAAGIIGAVLLFYWLTPEYQGEFYGPFYRFLRWSGPIVLVGGAVYFAWIDRYLVEPRDGYWHLGAFLTGQGAEVDWHKIGDLARTWVIKGFFLPLMYVYAWKNVTDLQHVAFSDRDWFQWLFDSGWSFGFLVDVVFTTMGYLLTLRLFDTHVRSAEPTMTGWVVALCCYQPFFGLMSGQYVMYEGGYYWGEWLEAVPVVKWIWGALILLLLVMFSGSTVAFGCRFSNLTHRGVITTGFYRWMRHPAYVSKCASYWLIFIPYVYNGSWYEVVRDCVWLTGLCVIYWLRARTEERHLSRDPDYVKYALYMNDHSVFAPLGRWFPFLAYRPPDGKSAA